MRISTLLWIPLDSIARDQAGQFLITGQVPGAVAAHTAFDIPLSAFGHGASLIGGTMDNTEVYFRVMHGVLGDVR